MAQGEESTEGRQALGSIYKVILAIPIGRPRDAVLLDALLTQADLVTDARRERISLAEGVVPAAIWLILFLGAALTLGFTFFFGVENLRAQVVMAGILAAGDLPGAVRGGLDQPPVHRAAQRAAGGDRPSC